MSETETNTPPEKPGTVTPKLTPDELLSLIQQLLADLAVAGHASRTLNHDGTLVIQVRGAARSVDAEGRVQLAAIRQPEPAPAAMPA